MGKQRAQGASAQQAEQMSELTDRLDLVTTQFSVLIASEAERRNQPVQNMVEGILKNLGEHAFSGRRRS